MCSSLLSSEIVCQQSLTLNCTTIHHMVVDEVVLRACSKQIYNILRAAEVILD